MIRLTGRGEALILGIVLTIVMGCGIAVTALCYTFVDAVVSEPCIGSSE